MMGDNARPTGYQAVHTSFSLPKEIAFGDDGDNPYNLFFEVQVTSGQAHGYNQTGASPALYKARLGQGAQAEALQARAKLKPGELLSREHAQIIKQITIEVESFHARSEHFNDPNRKQVLSTNILLEMSTSEWLRQHSTALQFIYEADAAGRPDAVVTPTFINERDFMFLFEQLMPGMSEDPDFTHAYELSKSIHTLQSRDRPGYDHFTGHVLASVLGFALKQASKSDFNDQIKHFDSVLITLLHDTPEDFVDVLNSSGKASEIPRVINKLLQIKEHRPAVFYAILKMNKPDKLPGETSQQREDRYINNLPEITYPAKFFERMNSWRHDLESMQEFVMEGDDDGLEEAYVKAEKYIMKSIGVLKLMKAHGFAYEAEWFIAQYALFGIDIEV